MKCSIFIILNHIFFVNTNYTPQRKITNVKDTEKMLCTPKVRQTFGGAYFYERKEKNEQKILARIQNICYTVYAK